MPSPPAVRTRPSTSADAFRFLTFRADRATLLALDGRHLALGLAATWLVGMGRWWDDPRALWAQKAGLGSLVYVFALATVLWLLLLPLRLPELTWRRTLTCVTLTAPPAALYAIPVERWTTVEEAIRWNVGFLAVVALWRVALVVVWAVRALDLAQFAALHVIAMPIVLVAWGVAAVNPERAHGIVLDVMAGVRDRPPPSPGDGAYAVTQIVALWGFLLALPLVALYVLEVLRSWRGPRRWHGEPPRPQETAGPPPVR